MVRLATLMARRFVAALLLLVAATPASGAPIRLLAGDLEPQPMRGNDRQQLAEWVARRAADGRQAHVLVQLERHPSAAERAAWRDRGVRLGTYVPERAWLAAVDSAGLRALFGDDRVSALVPWTAERKQHPRLLAGRLPAWSRLADDEVLVALRLHADVPLDALGDLARRHGGSFGRPVVGAHGALARLPVAGLASLAGEEIVAWIEPAPAPLVAANDGVRSAIGADPVLVAPYGLSGFGVAALVYDSGAVLRTHQTFQPGNRVTILDGSATGFDHATHVAGTLAGDGNDGRAKGVAPRARILSAGLVNQGAVPYRDDAGDLEADYALGRSANADLASNSLGSNAAQSASNCDAQGDYGLTEELIDAIVRGDDPAVNGAVVVVWANGNDRAGLCGTDYATVMPPACAKNPIHVGANNSDGASPTIFSSWGPCDDGRLKPTVVAPGCESGRVTGEAHVHSSRSTGVDVFGPLYGLPGTCGTSMATPVVAGVVALLIESWRLEGHGDSDDRPLPALVKALIVETATDLGRPGPDFETGFGQVDAKGAIDLLRDGGPLESGLGAAWGAAVVDDGGELRFPVVVPAGSASFGATLAWDDAAAAAFSAGSLVNDLDLHLESPTGARFEPWLLDPQEPAAPATTGPDRVNNQEQVDVAFPVAGTWQVVVSGSSVPVGPQTLGLAWSTRSGPRLFCAAAGPAGDFEAPPLDWTLAGAVLDAAPGVGHGLASLRLGGSVGAEGALAIDTARVDVELPSSWLSASLRFDLHLTTTAGDRDRHSDLLVVEVRSVADQVLAVLDRRSAGWPAGEWQSSTRLDLTPWIGQTIRLAFRSENDDEFPSSFWIDDVAVIGCALAELFADGFESSDTSAWSARVP